MNNKTNPLRDALIIFTFILVMTGPAGATQPTYWQVGTGDWSNNDNWTLGEPLEHWDAIINNGGTATITEAEVCANFGVVNGHVEMSPGGSLVTTRFLGNEGVGGLGSFASFTQTGGVNETYGLTLGSSEGEGIYTLSGDGHLHTREALTIGAGGTGTFNHSGGTNRIGDGLNLGTGWEGVGTYNLSSTGELSVLDGNVRIGCNGEGAFTQSGGTHTIEEGNLYIAGADTSVATYEMSGGELSVHGPPGGANGNEYVGNSGTGTFIQSGGTHTVEQTLYIACGASSVGTYGLMGGTLSAGTIEFGAGTGTFNFSAGRLSAGTFKGDLYNYGGTLAPGSSAGTMTIEGDYEQESTGAIEIELGGLDVGTHYDKLSVTGTLTLNGTLDVVLINGFNPQEGDSFDILDFDSSQFTGWLRTINLPVLPAGLFWDTTGLYTTGEISVQPTTSILNLLSPVNGEILIMGSPYSITWNGNPSISDVKIEYSTNYGIDWIEVDPPNTGNSGSYMWAVPSVASTQCLVWISDAANSGVFDASHTVFTIREPDAPCGLIGRWSGDGNTQDSVGGNHGILNGATFAPGKIGQAFSFDGLDDYVQIPYDPSFNLSSFTLQAWVKFTQDTYACIISRPEGGNATDGHSFFRLASPHGWIGGSVMGEGQDYSSSVSTAPTSFNDDTWHMCTFVRDVDAGTNGEIRIYVDGESHWSCSDSSPGSMEHNLNGMNIGSNDGSEWSFDGLIDEVEIYNYALEGDEIWDMFVASAGESYTPFGPDVLVQLLAPLTEPLPVNLTFDAVIKAGTTSLTTATGPALPQGFEPVGQYYDLTTTASFFGLVTVCIKYDDTGMSDAQENGLRLYHYEGDAWVYVADSSVDTVNNIICGRVRSFSLFAVLLPDDITPPTIDDISVSPDVLWPANHKMMEVEVEVDATDNSGQPPNCIIVDVTCNEPINDPVDSNTEADWHFVEDNPLAVLLRAERGGAGDGRIYTILVGCIDASGNKVTKTVTVTVPHDQGKGEKK